MCFCDVVELKVRRKEKFFSSYKSELESFEINLLFFGFKIYVKNCREILVFKIVFLYRWEF